MSEADTGNLVSISFNDMEEPEWSGEIEADAYKALDLLKIKDWEISLLFCNDAFIRNLNNQYRGKDEPTDVLSFSQEFDDMPTGGMGPEGRFVAGDIIISTDTVGRNAAGAGIPLLTEIKRLVIHGILHLSGKDHTEEDDSMLKEQEQILESILNREREI